MKKDDASIYINGWPSGKDIRFEEEYLRIMGLEKPFSLKKELEEENDTE
jgi:hypothetical protein